MIALLVGLAMPLFAQEGGAIRVQGHQLLTERGLAASPLLPGYRFGSSVALVGDIDGDTVPDLAVGGYKEDPFGTTPGALAILLMNADGSVRSNPPPFTIYHTNGYFGQAGLTPLGDIGGARGLAVGAPAQDGFILGSVRILRLGFTGGQVVLVSETLITRPVGAPTNFGSGLAWLPNQTGGGGKLAIGASGPSSTGDVLIYTIDASGAVASGPQSLISDLDFPGGRLANGDAFGYGVEFGDADGDGTVDLLFVGAIHADGVGLNTGACWVCRIDSHIRVTPTTVTKINDLSPGFRYSLVDGAWLGTGLAFLGDTDADGHPEICIGAAGWHRAGTAGRGVVYCVEIDAPANGAATIISNVKIHEGVGGDVNTSSWGGICPNPDLVHVGYDIAVVGDTDHDGWPELMIGAPSSHNSNGTIGAVLLVDYSAWFRTTAAFTPYGLGCAGAGREPLLWANSPPYLANANFRLIGTDAPPQAMTALGLGVRELAVDLTGVNAPGCLILLDPLTFLFSAADSSGVASYPLSIPPLCSLLDSFLRAQLVVFDRAANQLGLLTSRGVVLSIQH